MLNFSVWMIMIGVFYGLYKIDIGLERIAKALEYANLLKNDYNEKKE